MKNTCSGFTRKGILFIIVIFVAGIGAYKYIINDSRNISRDYSLIVSDRSDEIVNQGFNQVVDGWKRYTYRKAGFEIQYPPDWILDESAGGGTAVNNEWLYNRENTCLVSMGDQLGANVDGGYYKNKVKKVLVDGKELEAVYSYTNPGGVLLSIGIDGLPKKGIYKYGNVQAYYSVSLIQSSKECEDTFFKIISTAKFN